MNSSLVGRLGGATVAILGGLTAMAPYTFAPVCDGKLKVVKEAAAGMGSMAQQSVTLVPMKCHWTGQAAFLVGLLAAFTGLLILAWGKAAVRRALGIMSAAMGLAIVFIPTGFIIGVCASDMRCHTTRSYLYAFGAFLVVVGLGIAAALRRAAATESP